MKIINSFLFLVVEKIKKIIKIIFFIGDYDSVDSLFKDCFDDMFKHKAST
jgi:hypothetical protein